MKNKMTRFSMGKTGNPLAEIAGEDQLIGR